MDKRLIRPKSLIRIKQKPTTPGAIAARGCLFVTPKVVYSN